MWEADDPFTAQRHLALTGVPSQVWRGWPSSQVAASVVRLFVFALLFTMTDLRVHDPDLRVHDTPIFVFTILRNPHNVRAAGSV